MQCTYLEMAGLGIICSMILAPFSHACKLSSLIRLIFMFSVVLDKCLLKSDMWSEIMIEIAQKDLVISNLELSFYLLTKYTVISWLSLSVTRAVKLLIQEIVGRCVRIPRRGCQSFWVCAWKNSYIRWRRNLTIGWQCPQFIPSLRVKCACPRRHLSHIW